MTVLGVSLDAILEAIAIIGGLSVDLRSVLRPLERINTMPVAYHTAQCS
jgi:hypothetical protein